MRDVSDRTDLLNAKTLPISSPPIKWTYLDWPDATQLRFFSLSTRFREELKAAIRKRSHRKGNVKTPFLLFRETLIPFERRPIYRALRAYTIRIGTCLILRARQLVLPSFTRTVPNPHGDRQDLRRAPRCRDWRTRLRVLELPMVPIHPCS